MGTTNDTAETAALEECSTKPLAGRVDGRDCTHIRGLIALLAAVYLDRIKAAHARLIVGCQCCYCWEHDKRAMESALAAVRHHPEPQQRTDTANR